jgi:hypothetical protein
VGKEVSHKIVPARAGEFAKMPGIPPMPFEQLLFV